MLTRSTRESAVHLYWEVARRGFRRYSIYRGAILAGVFTNSVFGFLRAYVFIALFAAGAEIGDFDLRDTLTYTFVTQGLLMTIYLWSWWDIALSIRSGDVVTDLFRPYDYQLYWLAQDLGRALCHFLFRGIPPFVVGALVFDLRLPSSPLSLAAFLLSTALAVCVSFAIRFIVNLSAFWLLDYRGVGNLVAAAWTFLAGFVVPVNFFPGAFRTVAEALPFAATVQIPVTVFLEKASGFDLLRALGLQAFWAALLLLLGRVIVERATKRVVTHGG